MLFKEDELERLLCGSNKNDADEEYKGWWPPQKNERSRNTKRIYVARYALGILLSILICIFIITGPNIITNLKWWYTVDYMDKYWASNNISAQAATEDIINIPKIGTNASIVWGVDENDLFNQLKKGVASISQNAALGGSTPITITGLSNDYWWNNNKYGNVFALIGKLVVGDRIEIISNGNKYTYVVSKVKNGRIDKTEIIYQRALILVAPSLNIFSNEDVNILAYLESADDTTYFNE